MRQNDQVNPAKARNFEFVNPATQPTNFQRVRVNFEVRLFDTKSLHFMKRLVKNQRFEWARCKLYRARGPICIASGSETA
jgi:hypothetical protein